MALDEKVDKFFNFFRSKYEDVLIAPSVWETNDFVIDTVQNTSFLIFGIRVVKLKKESNAKRKDKYLPNGHALDCPCLECSEKNKKKKYYSLEGRIDKIYDLVLVEDSIMEGKKAYNLDFFDDIGIWEKVNKDEAEFNLVIFSQDGTMKSAITGAQLLDKKENILFNYIFEKSLFDLQAPTSILWY